jgi:hypothetical protein
MCAIFPSDGLAWGVGVVVGAVVAGLILLGAGICLRKLLCPPQELDGSDPRFEQTMPAAPREADEDTALDRLEVESTGSQDRAPKFVGSAFEGDGVPGAVRSQNPHSSGNSDDDADGAGAHSDRGESDAENPPPHTLTVRNVVMRRTGVAKAAKNWRY